MKYKQFDVAVKEYSDRLADLLRAAGIRFEQHPAAAARKRPVYVIRVHREDLQRAGQIVAEARRRENEAFVRTLPLVRRPFSDHDMLLALEPNDAGYYASGVYHGEPFDPNCYRVVRGGWDHEHCYLCAAKVLPGEEWWAAHPSNFDDEIGLCLDCYSRLFGSSERRNGKP